MRILSTIIVFCFSACKSDSKLPEPEKKLFELPVTINQAKFDTVEPWQTTSINSVSPKFIGQYDFADTVNFDNTIDKRDLTEQEYLWERNVYQFDTLSSDGLQIYPDYEHTVLADVFGDEKWGARYFPVYIVNETNETKMFVGKDRRVFAIQEAVDTSVYQTWYAIEAKAFDFCGNGYFRRKLKPKQFIVFLMPKYDGSDTTYIRTRILNGESVLISKPYRGLFSPKQFRIPKDEYWVKYLKPSEYKPMFYGATNKE